MSVRETFILAFLAVVGTALCFANLPEFGAPLLGWLLGYLTHERYAMTRVRRADKTINVELHIDTQQLNEELARVRSGLLALAHEHGWERAKPVAAFLLAAGLLCGASPLAAQEPPATFSGVLGAGVSLSDESAAIPVLHLDFNAPLVLGESPVCRVAVRLSLSGLPGESIDLREPRTWKAAEVHGELQRRIGADYEGSSTYLVGRAGFHTRILPRDQTPRDRYARSYGLGVRVERRDAEGSIRRSIALLYGRSDVASPQVDRGQLMLEGSARLLDIRGAELVLGGDAYLNVSRHAARGARDVMRLWVGVSWGG